MYFNHAFKKVFVGTKDSATEAYDTNVLTQAGIDYGFITSRYVNDSTEVRIKTKDLQSYGMGAGTFAFFDTNYEIVQAAYAGGQESDISNACCPLYLVSASWRESDKLGDFHGGYLESKKSPLIHAKNVSKVYRVDECTGRQQVLSVGYTPYTNQTVGGVATTESLSGGTGYTDGAEGVATTGGTGTGLTVDIDASAVTTNQAIATLTVDTAGTGYSDSTEYALSGGSGSGATATVTAAAGPVTAAVITTPGTDYEVGDLLYVAGGNGDAILEVATVTTTGGVISAVTIADAGVGYTAGDTITIVGGDSDATFDVATITASIDEDELCEKQYLCGEVYNFGIEIKRSPALRFMNHNIYQTLGVSTGCCDGDTPTAVDPTLVYIELAKQIVENSQLKDFVAPVVFDTDGNAWYAPGTTVTLDGTDTAVESTSYWTEYDTSTWDGSSMQAGIRLYGAYIDTKFGNCSFKVSDFYEKEPIRFSLYLTDMDGQPCEFSQLCSYTECEGLTGEGYGESVIRDVLLDELYAQNPFHCDVRLREVLEEDSVYDIIDRNEMYTQYYIAFNIDRKQNPTSVHNNDQYLLEIITKERSTSLETFLTTWLETNGCASCLSLEDGYTVCDECDIIPDSATASV